MACKIQIKENIIAVVEGKTNHALDSTLEEAVDVANRVNAEFNSSVVGFTQNGEKIERQISVPESLVNTYYDYEVETENQGQIALQAEDMKASRASKALQDKTKAAIKQMGVDLVTLDDYLKGNPDVKPGGINGLADLTKGVIAVSLGKEDTALLEEYVHVASAMLEQTNPALITKLISKIEKFQIYKTTLEAYKGKKAYQLSNGKPDIRKIKKEAVDKLIAEVIINASEGSTEFPELMDPVIQEEVRSWWRDILDAIRQLFGKSDIAMFEKAGDIIINGNVGTFESTGEGVFLQAAEEEEDLNKVGANPAVDNFFNIINIESDKMQLIDADPANNVERHYTYDGRTVTKSVTQKVKEKIGKLFSRTEEEQVIDNQKRDWGSEGHAYVEKLMYTLIDEDGFRRAIPLSDDIETELSFSVSNPVKNYIKELVASYPNGTRFLVEKKVINTKEKGLLGSTMDWTAIVPTTEKDGTKSFVTDILDWKFTSINKSEEDIPWYKRKEWIPQMGEYTKMLYQYGMKPKQLRKARMIPFIMNYEYLVPGNPKSGLVPVSVEVGKLDSTTETNLYLLPVPVMTESTGNPEVDSLVRSLDEQWKKLYKTPVDPEEKNIKDERLNSLNRAIRTLHLKIDFAPLADVAADFLDNSARAIADFAKQDLNGLPKEVVAKQLNDLNQYLASAHKFASMDKVFLSQYPREGMSKDNQELLARLSLSSSRAERMQEKIVQLQTEFAIDFAVKEGVSLTTYEDVQGNRKIQAEVPISSMEKTFMEGSRVGAKLINLASNLVMRAGKEVNMAFLDQMQDYEKLLVPLEQVAKAQGKKAFDMVGKIGEKGLQLKYKLDKAFIDDMTNAKKTSNKKFLIDNMNQDAFRELAEKAIATQTKYINEVLWSTDPQRNEYITKFKIESMKNSIDIFSPFFDGFEGYYFNNIYKQVIKEEDHLSDEYKEMAKSPEALAMWEYMVGLNTKGRNLGYIDAQGTSFFPLVEATTLQKISNSNGDILGQLGRSLKDLALVDPNEEHALSKIDPETGKIKKSIPKYFTRTNKEVSELSTDLTKVGALWIKSLLEYESNLALESTLLTLHSVEKAKGTLILDEQSKVIFEGGQLKVDKENSTNADIMQTIIDDAIYGLREDLKSIGNIQIAKFGQAVGKEEEQKQNTTVSTKKVLKTLDSYIQAMAVGLKPLIGAANWFGTQAHAYISSGNVWTFGEFQKNHGRMLVGGKTLSDLEKALMLHVVPLGDEVFTHSVRDLSKKIGGTFSKDYLSTWSFSDIMMVTNAFPEHALMLANSLSFNENSMIVDGQIVPIRQYLKQQDALRYGKDENGNFKMSFEDRKALEKSFESRVTELKNTKALTKVATIENDKLVIPGVSTSEQAKYAIRVTEYARNLTGHMNSDNKAGYRRDTIMSSFMMFKNWIPKLVLTRTGDIKKNNELDEWEYGRMRAFMKTWAHMGKGGIFRMQAIINGTDEGLKILDEILEAKKEEHYRKTGETLDITKEEFYDLMRRQIQSEVKELQVLFGLMGLFLGIHVAEPPEDATDAEKNRYKYAFKLVNKFREELSFYYSPLSMESITKGSILPALGLASKGLTVITTLEEEARGRLLGDEEIYDKEYPVKYFLNLIPVAGQVQTEVLPLFYPELAKDMGIRVTKEARRQ